MVKALLKRIRAAAGGASFDKEAAESQSTGAGSPAMRSMDARTTEEQSAKMSEIIRKRMVFYGDVQGVGFRYRAKYGAQELGVTGWVKNEWDGTVVMEAQGTEEQIARLITAVRQGTYVDIRDIRMKEIFPEEHEYSFHIR